MLPLIGKEPVNSNETNKFDSPSEFEPATSAERIWKQDRPPDSIEVIYNWCAAKLDLVKRELDHLDEYYQIDELNRFHTLSRYSLHLNRLKNFVGVSELKSSKTMLDVIELIKFNKLKYKMEELRAARQKSISAEAEEKQLTLPLIVPKSNSFVKTQAENIEISENEENQPVDETILEKPVTPKLNSDEAVTKEEAVKKEDEESTELKVEVVDEKVEEVQIIEVEPVKPKVSIEKKKQREKLLAEVQPYYESILKAFIFNSILKKIEIEEKIEVIRSDPVITPLLIAVKKNLIKIGEKEEADVQVLREVLDKTLEALHEKYTGPIEQVEELCNICEKYLLSFLITDDQNFFQKKSNRAESQLESFNMSLIKPEALLNAAIKYDTKRFHYINAVRSSLRNLRLIRGKFDDGTSNGISLEDLGQEGSKLSKRFDAASIQVMLIIPDFSAQLNACIHVLDQWVSYDQEYSSLIFTDWKEIDGRKRLMVKQKHVCEAIFNQLSHRLRLLKNNVEILEKEIYEANKKRFTKSSFQLEDLKEVKKISSQLESFEDKWKTFNSAEWAHLDCKTALEKLGKELAVFESELYKFGHSQAVNSKSSIEDNKKVDVLSAELRRLEKRIVRCYEEKKINPKELEILEKCQVKLKEIFMFKNSWEVMRKIFYDLPFPNLKFGLTNEESVQLLKSEEDSDDYVHIFTKHDQLLFALDLISSLLETDWMKYYYELPFYPERGYEIRKKDLEDCLFKFATIKDRSFCSLNKWKRFNPRARLDDLKATLRTIGRSEILNELNEKLFTLGKKKNKKLSLVESDQRKREAEMLHQKLVKFFEKKNLS